MLANYYTPCVRASYTSSRIATFPPLLASNLSLYWIEQLTC